MNMLFINNKSLHYKPLLITMLMMGFHSPLVYAKDYFNLNALSNIDDFNIADLENLDQFSVSGQLPGTYNVKVILNDDVIGIKNIDFISNHDNQLEMVFTKRMLRELGVKTDVIATLSNVTDDEKLSDIGHYIDYATAKFDFAKQVVVISIPQIALDNEARGQIDPALLDQGIPAFTLNYDFNGAKSWYKNSGSVDNQFLSLRSGFNLGAWRLRNYSTYEHNDKHDDWHSVNTYLERDIQPLKSQLTLGESTTTGDIFSGFQFKGVKMASDESMQPYSLRGFAPVVRGFAQSNAKVTIRQNGAIIYQTYVSPGPFALNDLYPTSYSGNLDVTVEEDNGSQQSFVVPFSSLAIMQREGGIKYSLTAGQYRPTETGKSPDFVEGTLIYGLPWNTTLFGGALLSKSYQSYALGIGFNLGNFGAISMDASQARTKFDHDNQEHNGQAYRFQYSKTLQETQSTISLESYLYSSKGFYDFSDANENRTPYSTPYFDLDKRTRHQINLSQSLSRYGSVYVSAYQQDYWHSSEKERNINVGYNVTLDNISYGLSYGYTSSSKNNTRNNQFSFRMNIPFDALFSTHNYLTSSVNYSGQGKTTAQVGISGNALDNNLSYSVQQSYQEQDHYTGGNASIGYQGSYGAVNMGYAYTENSQRLDYGLQGGLVVHQFGMTLSQSLGDTIALIAAPGASDVPVMNAQSVSTNPWGYAVKPYLTPYAENKITLDIDNLDEDVDLIKNNISVTPTKGAVVLAKMDTQVGDRILMVLTLHDAPLPFGSIVTLDNGGNSGIVGDNGEVYLSGMPKQGALTATWGKEASQMCKIHYQIPNDLEKEVVKQISAQCTQ